MSNVFTHTVKGRFIMGDLYTANQKTDSKTNQPVVKDGKPVMQYFLGLAIPKTVADWKQEPALKPMYDEAVRQFPAGQHTWPSFAYKIEDGDMPNQKGRKYEHAAGCWLLKFQTQIPFKKFFYSAGAWVETAEGDIKCGDYVQVNFSYTNNGQAGTQNTPGMYLSPLMVAFDKRGVEIVNTPEADPTTAGFTPGESLGTGNNAGAAFSAPANQQAAAQQQSARTAANTVQPNHDFLNAVPDDIPDLPAAGPQLTAKAPAGVTYEMFIQKGWTDAKMRAAGYLV